MDDFYFDDEQWTIRYIVVATGLILPGRKVLISPLALRHPAWSPLHINVNLTTETGEPAVPASISISLFLASTKRNITSTTDFLDTGKGGASGARARLQTRLRKRRSPNRKPQRRIRPRKRIYAACGKSPVTTSQQRTAKLGTWTIFLFDGETWEIRYAIISTKNRWPGKKVLLRPQWIQRVSWADREIYINMSREIIRKSPQWNAEQPVSREYELRLHKHYGYAPYWTPEE